jgi:hypothetical protein
LGSGDLELVRPTAELRQASQEPALLAEQDGPDPAVAVDRLNPISSRVEQPDFEAQIRAAGIDRPDLRDSASA